MHAWRGTVLALLAPAACGGSGASEPRPPATVHIVGCQPAVAAPVISARGLAAESLGSSDELRLFRARERLSRTFPNRAAGVHVTVISGPIERAHVKRVADTAMVRLDDCRDRQRQSPREAATVTASFVISATGRPEFVATAGTADAEVRTCVGAVYESLRFIEQPVASRVTLTLSLDPPSKPGPLPEAEPAPDPWTPYAIDLAEQPVVAATMARGLEGALRRRAGELDACFATSKATGSVRAMLEVNGLGRVTASRIGGLGDREIEACLGKAMSDLSIVAPSLSSVEVACDLARGDAARWRVSPEAGYRVIRASRTELRQGDTVLRPGTRNPDPLPEGSTYLVVADPDTPGAMIDLALTWAHESEVTLLALAVGDGPPTLLGVGRSIYAVAEDPDMGATPLVLVVGAKAVARCDRSRRTSAPREAPLADAKAVSALVGEIAASCGARCPRTLGISVENAAAARDLVDVIGTARRHGFARVLLGSAGCVKPGQHADEAEDEAEDGEPGD